MKILVFTDQHPYSLGGAQNSVLLQAKYLQKEGHTVTIVSPALANGLPKVSYSQIICYKSIPLPGKYSAGILSKRALQQLKSTLLFQGNFDVVHIQADFWGAIIGTYIANSLRLPVVYTLHNNVPYGLKKTLGDVVTRLLIFYLSLTYRKFADIRVPITYSPQIYMAHLVRHAEAVIVPTNHFYQQLLNEKILNERATARILPTGIDDDLLERLSKSKKKNSIIWSGRLSNEKRILFFLEAVRLSKVGNPIHIYGDGPLRGQAERYVRRYHMQNVQFKGAVSYQAMLTALSEARLLVQTSINFETQGMTVYEAASLGTKVLVCDKNILNDMNHPMVHLADGTSPETLALSIQRGIESLSMTKKARSLIHESIYKQSRITKKQENIYMSIVKKTKVSLFI